MRVVGGERDAPVWTDDYTAFGMGDKAYGFTVAVAWWLPAALFAALPAVRVTAVVRRRLRSGRRRDGHCPACGYDLRATPGRCPECGTIPAR